MADSFEDIVTGISFSTFPKDAAAREAIAIVNNKVEEIKEKTVIKQEIINLENKVKQSGYDNDNKIAEFKEEIEELEKKMDGIDGGNYEKIAELEEAVNDKAPRDLVDSLLGQIKGSIKQVNGNTPDENGNVDININTVGLVTQDELTEKTDEIALQVFNKAETSVVNELATQVEGKASAGSVNDLTSQLKDIAFEQPTWNLMGTGLSTTIASAFPSVTLADVKSLNVAATLEDTADWYSLQKTLSNISALNDLDNKRIIYKQGVYILSKPLRVSGKIRNLLVEAYGVYLKPKSGYIDFLLEMVTMDNGINYPQGVYFKGLEINGLFKSKGMKIDFAQEWNMDDVVIRACTTGFLLQRTWYGSLAGENRIWDCLIGVQLGNGEAKTDLSAEVNTIDFTNLKMNFSESYKGSSWFNTNEDSYGFFINCTVMGIKPFGVTIEGYDYGYGCGKASDRLERHLKFDIKNNYFEDIKKAPVSFLPDVNVRDVVAYVEISGSRLHGNAYTYFVILGQGDYKILNNHSFTNVKIRIEMQDPQQYYGFMLETDALPEDISIPFENFSGGSININSIIRNRIKRLEPDKYDWKSYSPYNVTVPPAKPRIDNSAPSLQDSDYLVALDYSQSSATILSKYYNMYSPSNRDMTFIRPELGVVLKDRVNGQFYRLKMENGVLGVEVESNNNKLFERVDAKRSKWFEFTPPTVEGEVRMNIEFGQAFTGKNGKWTNTSNGIIYDIYSIGSKIATVNPGAGYQMPIFNTDIHQEYGWENDYWGYGHINWGTRSLKRAVGTTAQRPTSIFINFIYYDTTIAGYVKWDGSVWTNYTPV